MVTCPDSYTELACAALGSSRLHLGACRSVYFLCAAQVLSLQQQHNAHTTGTVLWDGCVQVVSYWADSALLADNVQYPNFARTIPASDMEAYSTVSVIKELGWNNFAFIYSVARSEWFRALSEAAARVGIRLVTAQKYELGASDEETFRSIEQAVAAVANSGARIILEAVDYNEFPHLVRAAEAHNLTGRGYQW
eukprot:2400312-Rhodomonas_salina.3